VDYKASKVLSKVLDPDTRRTDYFEGGTGISGLEQDGISVQIPNNRLGSHAMGSNYDKERTRYIRSFLPPEDAAVTGTRDIPLSAGPEDFKPTAFWLPHIVTDENGVASFEFDAPEQAGSWTVRIYAITPDLKFGSAEYEVESAP
jgi:hypothetical protein